VSHDVLVLSHGEEVAGRVMNLTGLDSRLDGLKNIDPGTWDTFLDEVEGLLDAINDGSILAIARRHVVVADGLKYIRKQC